MSSASEALFEALRAWRLVQAEKMRVPAFRILSDRTLWEIADATPQDEGALLRVHGIGPSVAGRFGPMLLEVVSRYVRR